MILRNAFFVLAAVCVLAVFLIFAYTIGERNGYEHGYAQGARVSPGHD